MFTIIIEERLKAEKAAENDRIAYEKEIKEEKLLKTEAEKKVRIENERLFEQARIEKGRLFELENLMLQSLNLNRIIKFHAKEDEIDLFLITFERQLKFNNSTEKAWIPS